MMSPTPCFDRLAACYWLLEWGTFGPILHRIRLAHLATLRTAQRVLVLGDGDGRFVAELLRRNRAVRVVSVDASPVMIRQARRRVAAARVEWLVADARTLELPSASFDAIVTNFFLDCFPAAELSLLIARLAPLLKDGGHWFDGDFRPPTHCLGQWHLTLMYHFFRWQTKLGTMQLIDPAPALIQSGFTLQSEYPAVGGYLSARWWRR